MKYIMYCEADLIISLSKVCVKLLKHKRIPIGLQNPKKSPNISIPIVFTLLLSQSMINNSLQSPLLTQ